MSDIKPKRGRPFGSRNKPKDIAIVSNKMPVNIIVAIFALASVGLAVRSFFFLFDYFGSLGQGIFGSIVFAGIIATLCLALPQAAFIFLAKGKKKDFRKLIFPTFLFLATGLCVLISLVASSQGLYNGHSAELKQETQAEQDQAKKASDLADTVAEIERLSKKSASLQAEVDIWQKKVNSQEKESWTGQNVYQLNIAKRDFNSNETDLKTATNKKQELTKVTIIGEKKRNDFLLALSNFSGIPAENWELFILFMVASLVDIMGPVCLYVALFLRSIT